MLVAVLALCCAVAAGCASGDRGGLTTVTVGVGNTIFDTPLRVAQAKGFFREEGLDVRFVNLTASLGAPALESDSVQFYNSSPTSFLTAVNRNIPQAAVAMNGAGSPLGLVVSTAFARDHQLSPETPPTEVAKALIGSVGGASSTTTKGQAGIFLKAYGVSPSSIRWATLPSPAANKAALNNGQIDWFVTSEPTPLQVQDEGTGVVVAGPDTVPAWSVPQSGYGQVVVVRQDYAQAQADVVRRFVQAVQRGSADTRAHENDAVAIMKQIFTGMPDSVVLASLRQVDWPETAAMDADGWRTSIAFVSRTGAAPPDFGLPSGSWTNEFVAQQ